MGGLRLPLSGGSDRALLRHALREQGLRGGGARRRAPHRGSALARLARGAGSGGHRRVALRGHAAGPGARDPARETGRQAPHLRLPRLLGARGAARPGRAAAPTGHGRPPSHLHARQVGRPPRPAESRPGPRGASGGAGERGVLRLRGRPRLPRPRADARARPRPKRRRCARWGATPASSRPAAPARSGWAGRWAGPIDRSCTSCTRRSRVLDRLPRLAGPAPDPSDLRRAHGPLRGGERLSSRARGHRGRPRGVPGAARARYRWCPLGILCWRPTPRTAAWTYFFARRHGAAFFKDGLGPPDPAPRGHDRARRRPTRSTGSPRSS